MSKVKRVVLHCSASPDNVDVGVAEIRQWHIKDRGWTDIGYQYVVRRNGVVEIGRYENGDSILQGSEVGAHVKGHNSDSVSVCWVGQDQITTVQRKALLRHVVHLLNRYGLSFLDVYGHYELDPGKTCPNLVMDEVRDSIRHMILAEGKVA